MFFFFFFFFFFPQKIPIATDNGSLHGLFSPILVWDSLPVEAVLFIVVPLIVLTD